MKQSLQRYLLLAVGATVACIGLAYTADPNLLLGRYEISVAGVSEDNMYRGAYGGLFLTLGLAIAYGFFSATFRRMSTLIAFLFMCGFALGRIASITLAGIPHEQIVGLLAFEVVTTAIFGWLFFTETSRNTPTVNQPPGVLS